MKKENNTVKLGNVQEILEVDKEKNIADKTALAEARVFVTIMNYDEHGDIYSHQHGLLACKIEDLLEEFRNPHTAKFHRALYGCSGFIVSERDTYIDINLREYNNQSPKARRRIIANLINRHGEDITILVEEV
jgi:hypothetical protein